MSHIKFATVLGAGTMGAQIAAQLANAGVPVLLLDVTADAAARGLARASSLKPSPFFVPETARLIRTGSFAQLTEAKAADWIIEAVIEDLDVKRALLSRVDAVRAPDAVVSSNTSGISIAALADGRSDGFRAHWLGTHFFNPPRYLHLVEFIPTAATDQRVTGGLADFVDRHLGKGVVFAKDTPGFIANRIGLFGLARLLEALASGDYTIEDIDAITGPPLGRPKSATFRTLDLAGLDVLTLVAGDLTRRLGEQDRRSFEWPALVDRLIARGFLGEKSGQGFYKRVSDKGETKILTLDPAALEAGAADPYRPAVKPAIPSLETAGAISDLNARLRHLLRSADMAGRMLRPALVPTLEEADRFATEVAYSTDDVDRAMRWGFGWELGPFETLDALEIPTAHRRDGPLPPANPEFMILHTAKASGRVVRRNPSADLVDLDDGVLCVEFHSKMNTIGGETMAMLQAGLVEAAANFEALVIGGESGNFSAGANLMLLLLEAQEQNWDEIDAMIRAFQETNMAIKTSPVPVVAAGGGLALGGGCEICLHASRVQAAAETYIGLVELGVGLIPAAGGSKEMLVRASASAAPAHTLQASFETIALAKVSTSAADARRLGYLRDADEITMNRQRLIADAKATARHLAREGYQPPIVKQDVPVGGPDGFAVLALGVHLAWRAGRATEFDATVARKLAWVLTGGNVPHRTTLTELQLLDLEREAFLSLCGEPKTLERIAHTLKTGKPLRN
jgi:3-hydroxyacyl-CoA dehydrogenase